MFIFDSLYTKIFDEALQWVYTQAVLFASEFLSTVNNMGAALFDLEWISSYLEYIRLVGWALFIVGFVVAVFEMSLEYMNGQGNVKGFFLNMIKGFMMVSLFTSLPIELYRFSVTLQSSLTSDILNNTTIESSALDAFNSINIGNQGLTSLVFIIMFLYALIKVFMANLKRGGILLILISLGCFHVFSLPRSYTDAFVSWCKQVIALCFTCFMQTILLSLGLMIIYENVFLGIGIALASTEVPRIAEKFGMDTSMRVNPTSSMYAITSAMNFSRMMKGG